MLSRRLLLDNAARLGAVFAWPRPLLAAQADEAEGIEVNDVQSRLNATKVNRIVQPTSLDDIRNVLREAKREGRAICVAGGRHAMGGQQFVRDGILLDTKRFKRVVSFDLDKGLIEVEAGIEWPELIAYLNQKQVGLAKPWAIRQKQTGVDRVSLGGSLASNIHGRGLRFPPIVDDVESFVLMDTLGELRLCSRRENAELFSLAIGGYGLFGIITRVKLRLVPRTKLQRVVEIIAVKDLVPRLEKRLAEGFLYGDCQFATDLEADAQSLEGVFACYRPVPEETPIPDNQKQLSEKDWVELYLLARTDKKRAFARYSEYYLSTSGQVYWSDTNQLAGTFDEYRKAVDVRRGTEMITEVYVAKENFHPLMTRVRKDFVEHGVDLTYGTIRTIERDADSFLPWAKASSVCIVYNLHVKHTDEGKTKAAEDFRRIINRAIEFGGSYYLTYHRWATRKQIEACYPRFVEFLRLKKKYDTQECFQSDWYRQHKEMFAGAL